jgi:hypothetical protein
MDIRKIWGVDFVQLRVTLLAVLNLLFLLRVLVNAHLDYCVSEYRFFIQDTDLRFENIT